MNQLIWVLFALPLCRAVRFFGPVNAFKTLKGKLAKLHHKISNICKNHLHQISSAISKNHAIVYVEDLKVANMSKSVKGTVDKHGKNVKQKSCLNRAILDQSWYEFRRQLDYKLSWNGGHLIVVANILLTS